MKKLTLFIIIGFLSFTASKAQVKKPNIILIMVDDMGYADIGCYGGEIPTPNIDQLAKNGIRFSQFYNTARCCPTRASLLTGLFPHQTGIGHMTNPPNAPDRYSDWNSEGYQGYLNRNCLTLAEGLKEAGYHTYMTGKWHLGYHEESRWPLQRGFEKFYGSIPGACSYFWPNGNRPVSFMNEHLPPPDSTTYYTTDAFTDYAIQFIDEQQDDSPFFLYLAYNAPHWPLHAKKEDIKKFIGKYMHGWDEVRKKRLEKQIEMGLLDPETILSERDHRVRPWVEVSDSQKVLSDYRMAVYAAQIYSVDYNIGKLVEKLKAEDQYENTLILFLSDNGGCAEMYDEFGSKPQSYINKKNYSGAVSYGIGWANASNTPFYNYKVKIDEGGISTPLIAHWPEGIINQEGKINHQPGYLIDIAPTLYEIAGFNYPRTFHQGNEIPSLKGNSLLPIFKGKETHPHEFMYWEHQNNKAIRKGKWKASMDATASTWKLFNLEEDRIESKNLADQYPELVEELEQKWEDWAKSHKVLPKKN
ncbi:arylsulfatase [Flexithrix dorotheae]|uniref:arylsulfatase n=1 Tax=Flexithrix dorotheae TaxID=70993 RepID=UPI00035F576D|nr:arylsulfatase [Flexithrix dorotheae]